MSKLPRNKQMPRNIIECDQIKMDKKVYCNACTDIAICEWPDKRDIEEVVSTQAERNAELEKEIQAVADQLYELYDNYNETALPEIYGSILGLHERLEIVLGEYPK